MLLLVVILIAVGGAALKLLMDRQSMATMIDDYGQTLTSMPVPPGPATQAFASARQRAGSGDFAGAKSDLKRGVGLMAETATPPAVPEGAMPEAGPRGPSPADLGRAAEALPEKVRPFFKDHPDLLRQVMMVRMRAEGRVAPAEMEKHAERVMEAAAAGDEEKVKSILEEIRGSLGPAGGEGGRGPGGRVPGGGRMPGGRRMPGGGGMPGAGPRGAGEARGQVQQWITQGRRILAEARRTGADTKKAAELINRAEQLLARGNEQEAAEKMREAMGEMRGLAANAQRGPGRAPRGAPGMARRPGGARVGGGGGGPMAMPGILGTLLGRMQTESAAIMGAMEDIQNASVSLLEKNQAQVREILSSATSKLQAVGRGRAELNKELQAMQRAPREAPQEGPPRGLRGGPGMRRQNPDQPGGPFAEAAAEAQRRVHDLLGRALDEARTLSPEEYEEEREEMIERFVAALMAPPDERLTLEPGRGLRPGSAGLPPLELPAEEPADQAERDRLRERVRERLRMLHEPYLMLMTAGAEMEQVERLIGQAREAFTADKLVDAGKSVNHAADLIWQLLQIHRADLQAAKEDEKTGGAQPEKTPEASEGGRERPRRPAQRGPGPLGRP